MCTSLQAIREQGLPMARSRVCCSHLILDRDNPWTTLHDPARKTLRALRGRKSKCRWAICAWMTCMGAVIRREFSKIAVYRDDAGKLHERSAVCPHLGCTVSWNSTERSWDCPCHGSRFGPSGKVLNGPAIGPLEKVPPSHPNSCLQFSLVGFGGRRASSDQM